MTVVDSEALAQGPTRAILRQSPGPNLPMNKITIDLENCYGIKRLRHCFDFSSHQALVLYAPNGSMKSSLAKTFEDIANGNPSKDQIFRSRPSRREVTDETGGEIQRESVLVLRPYDEGLLPTERTSALLVNAGLQKEYEELNKDIFAARDSLLNALKVESKSRKKIDAEISLTFTRTSDQLIKALIRIKPEIMQQKDAPFAAVDYDIIFDDKVLDALGKKDVKGALDGYVDRYNELIAASNFFQRGIFDYHNAAQIAKSLSDNGFFEARHALRLNGIEDARDIATREDLEKVVQEEKDEILTDAKLKAQFEKVDKLLNRNVAVRQFRHYIENNAHLLPQLSNIDQLKEDVWKSYIWAHLDLYEDLISKCEKAEERQAEIVKEAETQRTLWQVAIDYFNDRFFVPFRLSAKNGVSVMLGHEAIVELDFAFIDGTDEVHIGREDLLSALSMGEKKALYILNIIFEIATRTEARQETIVVIDDIADSFDYQNKYAIIEYLRDVSENPLFKMLIMTHNFDFFRTIQSRFIPYKGCLMVTRDDNGINLHQAVGIKNVFVLDWKPNFFDDPKKKVASIPFLRNLIEYREGDADANYVRLTSLLHWKSDSASITEGDLESIFLSIMTTQNGRTPSSTKPVVDLIEEEANECLTAPQGVNFENKIVLSIAIRLRAEKFMASKINDTPFLDGLDANQTDKLLRRFRTDFSGDVVSIKALESVLLMTPENIHLNSFMYEPIVDMSDDHLRKLYRKVRDLV